MVPHPPAAAEESALTPTPTAAAAAPAATAAPSAADTRVPVRPRRHRRSSSPPSRPASGSPAHRSRARRRTTGEPARRAVPPSGGLPSRPTAPTWAGSAATRSALRTTGRQRQRCRPSARAAGVLADGRRRRMAGGIRHLGDGSERDHAGRPAQAGADGAARAGWGREVGNLGAEAHTGSGPRAALRVPPGCAARSHPAQGRNSETTPAGQPSQAGHGPGAGSGQKEHEG